MKNSYAIALFVMLAMFALTAYSQTAVPYNFLANTPAKAEEVNANFNKVTIDLNALRSQSASIGTRLVITTDPSGVGIASCNSGEVVVGGGCNCTGNNTDGTNFGVVFACAPAGQSYVGGCFNFLYNISYGNSPIEVKAICMQAVSSGATALAKPTIPLLQADPTIEIEKVRSRLREQQNILLRSGY